MIGLRSIEESDIPSVARWLNDGEVTHFMFYGQLPTNIEQVKGMIGDQIKSPNNTVFLVCDKETGLPIGFAGLYDIHRTARKAEFRVLIGDKEFWSKGYGTEVAELLTFYGFDRLNLHRLWLGVVADNIGGVKAYERAGYVREGTLKDEVYRNSQYYDSIRMAILRDSYYERYYEKHKARFAESGLAQGKKFPAKVKRR